MSIPKYMTTVTNIRNTNNNQYNWLRNNSCKHRHKYITHFNCFLKENNIKEKVGYLDIETSNLKANFGVVLCWCIMDEDNNILEDWMTLKDITKGYEDKRVVETCIQTMLQFDRVVGHYSTYFDIPFLRTRALIHGVEFPPFGSLFHTDVWRMARSKLCLHSNRQDAIAESLQGKTVKTRISHPAWRKAMLGNAAAMAEVVDHCEKDIFDLKKNHLTLLPFLRETRTSI